jgi:hypothetical protein
MVVPSIPVAYLYSFNLFSFASLTLAATLVIGVTFFGTSIAATVMPYTKKELYDASPIAKYRILGMPLLSVVGFINTLFLGYMLYQWLLDPDAMFGIGYSINEAGIKNSTSLIFMGALYATALIIYIAMRLYRRSKGVNLDVLYSEIPAE